MAEKDSLAVDFDKTGPETSCVEQADEEPEFHVRTWIALIAMFFFFNMVQVFALQGPPASVCRPVDDESKMVD